MFCSAVTHNALFLWRHEDTASLRLLIDGNSGREMISNFSLRQRLRLELVLLSELITKQACRDESVVPMFFFYLNTYTHVYIWNYILKKGKKQHLTKELTIETHQLFSDTVGNYLLYMYHSLSAMSQLLNNHSYGFFQLFLDTLASITSYLTGCRQSMSTRLCSTGQWRNCYNMAWSVLFLLINWRK